MRKVLYIAILVVLIGRLVYMQSKTDNQENVLEQYSENTESDAVVIELLDRISSLEEELETARSDNRSLTNQLTQANTDLAYYQGENQSLTEALTVANEALTIATELIAMNGSGSDILNFDEALRDTYSNFISNEVRTWHSRVQRINGVDYLVTNVRNMVTGEIYGVGCQITPVYNHCVRVELDY